MDPGEALLAASEEDCSMSELERVLLLWSNAVQSHRKELDQAKTELQTLEAEIRERSQSRESYVSLLAQTLDLQEALEEEEKTWQELREVREEMERLSDTPQQHSSEVLESKLKEMEDIVEAYREKERELLEETESLKKSLKTSQEKLAQTSSEHQKVTEELRTLQRSHPDHHCPGHSVTDHLLDSCIRDMGLLNLLPDNKRHKK